MNERQENNSECCRREFLEKGALGVAAVGGLSGFAVERLQAAEGKAASRFDYEPVAGWAKLPKDVAFVGVNGIDIDSRGRVYAAGGDENAILVFAPDGDIYITDGYGNSRVVRLAPDGSFRLAWGEKGDGAGQFDVPHSVAIDANNNLYVAEVENKRIQKFTLGK